MNICDIVNKYKNNTNSIDNEEALFLIKSMMKEEGFDDFVCKVPTNKSEAIAFHLLTVNALNYFIKKENELLREIL